MKGTPERTLVLVKPDGVQRHLVGRIITRFEEKGLRIVGLKVMQVGRQLAETHYGAHKSRPFFPGLIRFVTSAPTVAMVLEGLKAIEIVRKMMGATFGSKAEPGTLRGDFAVSNSFNLVHGSDSAESARREIELFFRPEEILTYTFGDEDWIYDPEGES
jgi:nucleoside-diphosphate kinase